MRRPGFWFSSFAVVLTAFGCDPSLTEEAKAGCEEATSTEEREGPQMLPGRECMSCHDEMTAAGTVFQTVESACNGEGVARVKVEILDEQGNTAITLTTNSAGNFYTKKALPNPYRARITAPDGTVREMEDSTDNGNCSHCHRVPGLDDAKGRIAVELTTSANVESAASDGS